MKINICDPCKKVDNVITETNRVLRVKKRRELNMDVCAKHGQELSKLSMVDYVRYVYQTVYGIKLTETDEEVKQKFLLG